MLGMTTGRISEQAMRLAGDGTHRVQATVV